MQLNRDLDVRAQRAATVLEAPRKSLALAETYGWDHAGDEIEIDSVSTFSAEIAQSLSFNSLSGTEDATEPDRLVLCTPELADRITCRAKLIGPDPRSLFFDILKDCQPDWAQTAKRLAAENGVEPGVYDAHPTAYVDPAAIVGQGCRIKAFAYIGPGCVLGQNVIVGEGTVIGVDGPSIFTGADGAQRSWRDFHWGTVLIEDNVEIGVNCMILRAITGVTTVSHDTIIGNTVHIGHGCFLGSKIWLAACVTLCGHTFMGSGTSVGAGTTVRDNAVIGTDVSIGMGSLVVKNIAAGEHVRGSPARVTQPSRQVAPNR